MRIITIAVGLLIPVIGFAQWLKYPTPGLPRNPDGTVNLSAPAPRTTDGKPDLAGLWLVRGGYVSDIARDLKPGDIPFLDWSKALYNKRRETLSKDDPTGYCIPGGVPRSDAVPYPFKILNAPGMVMILYEAVHSFRQIFTDGRALPTDPNPTWMGYSVGRWYGDIFAVETSGFNDHGWLDNDGHPNTDALRVTERFRRRNVGNMDVQITIEDSKAYGAPWTVTLPFTLVPDGELLEYVCNENNKDVEHLVGK